MGNIYTDSDEITSALQECSNTATILLKLAEKGEERLPPVYVNISNDDEANGFPSEALANVNVKHDTAMTAIRYRGPKVSEVIEDTAEGLETQVEYVLRLSQDYVDELESELEAMKGIVTSILDMKREVDFQCNDKEVHANMLAMFDSLLTEL